MNASWATVDTSAWLWTVHLGTSAKHADLIPPPKSAKDMVAVQVRLVKALRNVRFGSKADMCSARAYVLPLYPHVWTLRVGKDFLERMQRWSVQPCVRPFSAARRAAGHNALRGSSPDQ